jgi:hypothetical protein
LLSEVAKAAAVVEEVAEAVEAVEDFTLVLESGAVRCRSGHGAPSGDN